MIEGWLVLTKIAVDKFRYGGDLHLIDTKYKNKCKYLQKQTSNCSIVCSKLSIVIDWIRSQVFDDLDVYYARFHCVNDTLPPEYIYDTHDDIVELEKDYDNEEDFMHDFNSRLKNMGVTHILRNNEFKNL